MTTQNEIEARYAARDDANDEAEASAERSAYFATSKQAWDWYRSREAQGWLVGYPSLKPVGDLGYRVRYTETTNA